MLSKFLAHVRRQWMGALALFLVLTGGTAWAVDEWTGANIQDGTLTSADYRNNDIRSVDVRNATAGGGGLTGADLAPHSAGLDELDPAAFAAPDISPTASGGAFEIADNAVQSFEISDGVITGADVADNSLGASEIATGGVRAEELGPEHLRPDGQSGIPGRRHRPERRLGNGAVDIELLLGGRADLGIRRMAWRRAR